MQWWVTQEPHNWNHSEQRSDSSCMLEHSGTSKVSSTWMPKIPTTGKIPTWCAIKVLSPDSTDQTQHVVDGQAILNKMLTLTLQEWVLKF